MNDELTDRPSRHWTGALQPRTGMVRVDGQVLRWMERSAQASPAIQQTGFEITATRTTYHFEAHGIRLDINFLSPLLPNDLGLMSRPISYVTMTVVATDRAPHKAQLRFGAGSMTVERGAFVISLAATEEWEMLRTPGMTAGWAINPKPPWNYALAVNDHIAESALNVGERRSGNDLFTLKAPVPIQARGKRVLEWREEDGVAARVPASSVRSNESVETLTLVSSAAARLAITAFAELLEQRALKTVG